MLLRVSHAVAAADKACKLGNKSPTHSPLPASNRGRTWYGKHGCMGGLPCPRPCGGRIGICNRIRHGLLAGRCSADPRALDNLFRHQCSQKLRNGAGEREGQGEGYCEGYAGIPGPTTHLIKTFKNNCGDGAGLNKFMFVSRSAWGRGGGCGGRGG